MSTGTSQAPAYARTASPIAAGPIIITIARLFGLDLTVDQALGLVPVLSFLYYVVVRALEYKFPVVGYALGIPKQPAYSDEPAPSPKKDENVVAIAIPDTQPTNDPDVTYVEEGDTP